MPQMLLINQAKGPLPVSAKFDAPADGRVSFIVTGSAWSQQADQPIGIALELDGVPLGQALIFSNGKSTHRALIPVYLPAKLTFGPHAVTLVAINAATTSDYNDFFNVILDY